MMSSLLAVALLLIPSAASEPRKAFANCLADYARSSAEKKMAVAEFDSNLASACSKEETAFRNDVVASEIARGFTRKTAEQSGAEQVDDYLAETKERFRDALNNPN